MGAVSTLVLGELQRIDGVQSLIVIGRLSEELSDGFPGTVRQFLDDSALMNMLSATEGSDAVVFASERERNTVESRALGHAVAAVARRIAIVITYRDQAEVIVPLVELKRGMLSAESDARYVVYGARS